MSRFLSLFEYELQNRAIALYATGKAMQSTEQADSRAFWSAYHDLEVLNQTIYAPYAATYSLPITMSTVTQLRGRFAIAFILTFPKTGLQMSAIGAERYIPKLTELQSLAPDHDKAFFQYVVDQEEVQAEALTLAADGKLKEATAVLDAFVMDYHR